jgi:hypothetical protein
MFFPFIDEGTANLVLYQRILSVPTVFFTPERADSTAKGTSIFPWNAFGMISDLGVIA